MLDFTEKAKKEILNALKAEEGDDQVLRVEVNPEEQGVNRHSLYFIPRSEKTDKDEEFDAGGFAVVVEAASLKMMEGSTVDFMVSAQGAGFKVLPPKPKLDDPRAGDIQKVLEEKINPGVAMHGGFVELIDIKDDRVFLKLGGGCQGCGMVDVTLKQGITTMIKEAVPNITEVLDVTDHASGTNPYYQPGK